jgi:hypothetical protein
MGVEAARVAQAGVEPELPVTGQTRTAKLQPSRHHLACDSVQQQQGGSKGTLTVSAG